MKSAVKSWREAINQGLINSRVPTELNKIKTPEEIKRWRKLNKSEIKSGEDFRFNNVDFTFKNGKIKKGPGWMYE